MNWKAIVKYATAVFIAQFMLGFFEGLLFEPSVSVAFSFHAVALVFCGAIFLHLGSHQPFKPFVHAWAALAVEIAAAWALVLMLYHWFGMPDAIDVVFEYILLICALVAGTSFGIILRQKTNANEKT